MNRPQDYEYWLGVSVCPGIGPVRFQSLLSACGSVRAIWYAKRDVLSKSGIPESTIAALCRFRQTFDLYQYEEQLEKAHIIALPLDHPKYPRLLRAISDPPIVLYVKGSPVRGKVDMERTIAVVGARKTTAYGEAVARMMVRDLVQAGCTVVSGMAYGIDAVVHEEVIHLQGKTIAVLGCGVDIVAPAGNAHIYRKVAAEGYGAVVSEMPLGMRPERGLFPARNRIISGLSLGTIIIEGTDHSGTLITARNAAEQGREVFVVPGPITSETSRGPSILLRLGATLIERADEVVSCLGLAKREGNREQ